MPYKIAKPHINAWHLTKGEEILNLDFTKKCINFVVTMQSDLLRSLFYFVSAWKSAINTFYVRKTSFEERKSTLKERFWKFYALKFWTNFVVNFLIGEKKIWLIFVKRCFSKTFRNVKNREELHFDKILLNKRKKLLIRSKFEHSFSILNRLKFCNGCRHLTKNFNIYMEKLYLYYWISYIFLTNSLYNSQFVLIFAYWNNN